MTKFEARIWENAEPRTLEAMQNRDTRYEVAVTANGETFIVGYMARKTRATLFATARFHSDYMIAALGADADKDWKYSTVRGLEFSPTVRVYFTGRTERDARISMVG